MIAFMPAVALHSAAASLKMNPKPSFAPLPAVNRPIRSRRISTAPRENPRSKREMIANGGRACKKSIERNKRGDGGKDRKQAIENHTCCDRKQAVFAYLLIGAPENIFPAFPGYLPRRFGVPTPAQLMRPFVLDGPRLVALARSAKSARSGATANAALRAVNTGDLACQHHCDKDGRVEEGPERLWPRRAGRCP
jgi:hypothetical protein